MEKDNRKMASFRLKSDTINKLDVLATITGQSKSEIIDDLIFKAFDKVNNNQDTKEMLEKLRQVQEILSSFKN